MEENILTLADNIFIYAREDVNYFKYFFDSSSRYFIFQKQFYSKFP